MGLILLVIWPFLLLAAPFELAGVAVSNILGPFGEAAEVWLDYFGNMISF